MGGVRLECLFEPHVRKRTFWHVRPTKTQINILHPYHLIRGFVVRMKKLCILGCPKCVRWRFWSDCANVQFSDVEAHLSAHRCAKCAYSNHPVHLHSSMIPSMTINAQIRLLGRVGWVGYSLSHMAGSHHHFALCISLIIPTSIADLCKYSTVFTLTILTNMSEKTV